MRIRISLPEQLGRFADTAAKRAGKSRSHFLAQILEAERIRLRTQVYLERHGWDVIDDEPGWRAHQRRRMAEEYRGDKW
jgi:metal-responsive CopG/Arc/MetJ family transcriptional regulator